MRIEQGEIDEWTRPLVGKKGDAWPEQRTLRAILREGELHRFGPTGHVLVCRDAPAGDAHLITTTRLLEEGLGADELAFIKDLLAKWSATPTIRPGRRIARPSARRASKAWNEEVSVSSRRST